MMTEFHASPVRIPWCFPAPSGQSAFLPREGKHSRDARQLPPDGVIQNHRRFFIAKPRQNKSHCRSDQSKQYLVPRPLWRCVKIQCTLKTYMQKTAIGNEFVSHKQDAPTPPTSPTWLRTSRSSPTGNAWPRTPSETYPSPCCAPTTSQRARALETVVVRFYFLEIISFP